MACKHQSQTPENPERREVLKLVGCKVTEFWGFKLFDSGLPFFFFFAAYGVHS